MSILLVRLVAVLALAAPATNARTFEATAVQMLDLSNELVRRGKKDDAQTILDALTHDPDVNVRNEARMRWALLLEASGKLDLAAVLLRRILDEKPDATAVRFKLAMLLQKLGHEDSALRELRALRSTELPPDVARFVDRISASLQATKPFGVQVELALAPDSNINRATRSDTLGTIFGDFSLDKGSQARSGLGIALRGFAQARQVLTANLAMVERLSSEASLYRHEAFNDVVAEASVGPEWRAGRTRFSAEAAIARQWYAMRSFQRSKRLSASASRPIDTVSSLRLDLSQRWVDNQLNDLQDGHGHSIRGQYERALSPTLLVAVNAGIDRLKARDAAYSTRSWTLGASTYRDVGRMTLSARIEFGRLKADDRLALLPKAREDRLLRISLGSVFRQLTVGGFAPVTRLVVERNRSSVEFYDFRRIRTEFGISRAF